MKVCYLFDMLNEGITIEDARKRYYSNIPQKDFDKIIEADATTHYPKLGKWAKVLLDMYSSNNLKMEDLYKAKEYISILNKYRNSIRGVDPKKIKTVQDLYDAVKDYIGVESNSDVEYRIKSDEAEKVYEDERFVVIIPETEKASIYYGKNTQWCTAATGSNNTFFDYNANGPLYIIIDKIKEAKPEAHKDSKFQFHFESGSFMDETDTHIEGSKIERIGMTNGLCDYFKSLFKSESEFRCVFEMGYNFANEVKDGIIIVGDKCDSIMNEFYGDSDNDNDGGTYPEFFAIYDKIIKGGNVVDIDEGGMTLYPEILNDHYICICDNSYEYSSPIHEECNKIYDIYDLDEMRSIFQDDERRYDYSHEVSLLWFANDYIAILKDDFDTDVNYSAISSIYSFKHKKLNRISDKFFDLYSYISYELRRKMVCESPSAYGYLNNEIYKNNVEYCVVKGGRVTEYLSMIEDNDNLIKDHSSSNFFKNDKFRRMLHSCYINAENRSLKKILFINENKIVYLNGYVEMIAFDKDTKLASIVFIKAKDLDEKNIGAEVIDVTDVMDCGIGMVERIF